MPELQDLDIFRTILESLQTGVYVVGRDGRILFWNQGAESNLAAHPCLDVRSGAFTHALIQSHLSENLAFFSEFQLPFGVLYIRVEHMDEFRAAHGREAAEAILHVIVQNMKHTLGEAGFIGRWTEKHFLIIIPNCETRDLTRAAENVKRIVHSSGIQWWGDTLSVTVSLGQ